MVNNNLCSHAAPPQTELHIFIIGWWWWWWTINTYRYKCVFTKAADAAAKGAAAAAGIYHLGEVAAGAGVTAAAAAYLWLAHLYGYPIE